MSRWISYELERRADERRLVEKNERLEEFASIVSHDLRNPLEVAQGVAELAEAAGEMDPDRQAELVDALDRMERIVDDVLSLARTGGEAIDQVPVALATVASDAWETTDTADADLTAESGDHQVLADPSHLQQLLENLFRNSVEHGSTGSQNAGRSGDSVERAGSAVTVTVGPLDGGFYVEDDGPGIPEADRDEVFDAGFSTTSEGTGYGLHIVDEIASAHGWSVTVAGSDDGGTRFEFGGVGRP